LLRLCYKDFVKTLYRESDCKVLQALVKNLSQALIKTKLQLLEYLHSCLTNYMTA